MSRWGGSERRGCRPGVPTVAAREFNLYPRANITDAQWHPAHPAWIARKPEQCGDSIFIGQIGYFAGAEPPFAKLFREYLALNEKLKEDLKRRREPSDKQ